MRYENIDAIFTVLKRYPAGTTAAVVAEKLQWTKPMASQRLGKLAWSGMIDRVPMPERKFNLYRYQLKQANP